jgi:hypothetical protein
MDALVAMGLLLALLYSLRWIHLQICPGVVRFMERLVRQLVRTVIGLLWTSPVRRHGAATTLWLWGVALGVLVTVSAVDAGGEGLQAIAIVWLTVIGTWWGLRQWARWRYRPWALPNRRRGRQ